MSLKLVHPILTRTDFNKSVYMKDRQVFIYLISRERQMDRGWRKRVLFLSWVAADYEQKSHKHA